MKWIPIIGFVYEGVKVLWAQHQLSIGAVSFDAECVYFDDFNTATFTTFALLIPAWFVLRIMSARIKFR